jgi:hypothetical protein
MIARGLLALGPGRAPAGCARAASRSASNCRTSSVSNRISSPIRSPSTAASASSRSSGDSPNPLAMPASTRSSTGVCKGGPGVTPASPVLTGAAAEGWSSSCGFSELVVFWRHGRGLEHARQAGDAVFDQRHSCRRRLLVTAGWRRDRRRQVGKHGGRIATAPRAAGGTGWRLQYWRGCDRLRGGVFGLVGFLTGGGRRGDLSKAADLRRNQVTAD